MSHVTCPFCSLDDSNRVFHRDELVVVLWDGFPVSPGHALVVPRRHIAGWFEATADEHAALVRGIDAARAAILERHAPDGFNIGVNVGDAAGQTVFHLHVHLIPRYTGDVADPRGGVRCLIPEKARYWDAAEDEP
jgi:ATP adenylyltransferase